MSVVFSRVYKTKSNVINFVTDANPQLAAFGSLGVGFGF